MFTREIILNLLMKNKLILIKNVILHLIRYLYLKHMTLI